LVVSPIMACTEFYIKEVDYVDNLLFGRSDSNIYILSFCMPKYVLYTYLLHYFKNVVECCCTAINLCDVTA
jgi:hypothetical protein